MPGGEPSFDALNAEAAHRFSAADNNWSSSLSGGLGANIRRYDRKGDSRSDTDLGTNLLGGIERGLAHSDRLLVEGKFSLNDNPDAKVTVGWTFYH
jgi:hypothetical protein